MITAGVDIGASTSKAVILRDGEILSHSIITTGADSADAAVQVMNNALSNLDSISLDDIDCIVATGYGRIIVPFAHEIVTELSCHAKGVNWLFPKARTILDMGGQDCKAIRCDEKGRLRDFAMNDKCAAGTGRFLEIIARIMDLPLESLGELSLGSKTEIRINSTCAVFGKSEIALLTREGKDKKDILAGLHESVAKRVYLLLRRVGIEEEFVITGGIAKNTGVVRKIEDKIGMKALIPDEPQIVGALGAALFAVDRPR